MSSLDSILQKINKLISNDMEPLAIKVQKKLLSGNVGIKPTNEGDVDIIKLVDKVNKLEKIGMKTTETYISTLKIVLDDFVKRYNTRLLSRYSGIVVTHDTILDIVSSLPLICVNMNDYTGEIPDICIDDSFNDLSINDRNLSVHRVIKYKSPGGWYMIPPNKRTVSFDGPDSVLEFVGRCKGQILDDVEIARLCDLMHVFITGNKDTIYKIFREELARLNSKSSNKIKPEQITTDFPERGSNQYGNEDNKNVYIAARLAIFEPYIIRIVQLV